MWYYFVEVLDPVFNLKKRRKNDSMMTAILMTVVMTVRSASVMSVLSVTPPLSSCFLLSVMPLSVISVSLMTEVLEVCDYLALFYVITSLK
jgi:hypothetical protein